MGAAPHFMCYAQWAWPVEVTRLISAWRSTSVEIGSQFHFNFEDKGVAQAHSTATNCTG